MLIALLAALLVQQAPSPSASPSLTLDDALRRARQARGRPA